MPKEQLLISSALYSNQGREFGGKSKDSHVIWLAPTRLDGIGTHLSRKFPLVLAYSLKRLTSKLKLSFYSDKIFVCRARWRLETWWLTVVSLRQKKYSCKRKKKSLSRLAAFCKMLLCIIHRKREGTDSSIYLHDFQAWRLDAVVGLRN